MGGYLIVNAITARSDGTRNNNIRSALGKKGGGELQSNTSDASLLLKIRDADEMARVCEDWVNRKLIKTNHLLAEAWQEYIKCRQNGNIAPRVTLKVADEIARICDDLVNHGEIDSRSALADARLDYGNPYEYDFS